MTLPKPKHLTPEYGAQFSEPSVASAYRCRPPYPDEVYTLLDRLLGHAPRVVLELGCGLGEIARRLAAQTDRVDAVEPSRAMLALARRLPGGEQRNLQWYECTAEAFAYRPGYGLVIAAESLHWMEWDRVLPAIRVALAPHGSLVVLDRRLDTVPWWTALRPLIPRYSTNSDFQPYDLLDELARRQLFHPAGRTTTTPGPVPPNRGRLCRVLALTQRVLPGADEYVAGVGVRYAGPRDRQTVCPRGSPTL